MKSRKALMEQYEDAMFALIMYEILDEEGAELLRENERLKADPDFAVPAQTDRRSLRTIARAFGRQKRAAAAHTSWRVFQRVAVAAFIGLLLFTGVYAAFPEVRSVTLNLLIEVSDVSTTMRFGEDSTPTAPPAVGEELLPYEFAELPDGFELVEAGKGRRKCWKHYTDSSGAKIELEVFTGSDNMTYKFDTEDADNTVNVVINGNPGRIVEKDGRISVDFADEEHQIFVGITFYGVEREDALNVTSHLIYTGENF